MESRAYLIIPAQSSIDWIGRNVIRSHSGTIGIKKGALIYLDGQFIGGEIVIDVTALTILDIKDPATNEQLASHLLSADFFNSEEYPEAFLKITKVHPGEIDQYQVEGNITIRGITNPVVFDALIKAFGDRSTALTKLKIDRTRFGMPFRSGNFVKNLGSHIIANDFELTINLTAVLAN